MPVLKKHSAHQPNVHSFKRKIKVPIEHNQKNSRLFLYLIWVIALVATLGSLFFSEVMKLPPCVLCWYQRIAMYPLALWIPIAIICKETQIIQKYVLGLALIGFGIAIYHNLLYYGIIPESLTPCKEGVSCTSRQIEWFGFITIPLLSLSSFALILTIMGAGKLRGIQK